MPARKPDQFPQLKLGKTWCVEWYYTAPGGTRTRVRRSTTDAGIDLNAVPDLAERRAIAEAWMAQLRAKLAPAVEVPADTTVVAALQIAVELKRSEKAKTNKCFRETARWVSEFFHLKGWGALRCSLCSLEHVQAYFDYIILTRRVSNRTHNTRKNNLRSLWGELVARGYFPENYVSKIKNRPESDTIRRPLSEKEEAIIVREIQNDRALSLAFLIGRYLGVRPDEMRHLRCGNFDFKRGFLHFPGRDSKNRRNSVVTIPAELIPVLQSFGLEKQPESYFIFGAGRGRYNPGLMPRPEMIGVNTLSGKFRDMVRRLHREGKLQDVTGVQFYSLKDTLAVWMLDHDVDVESAMRHLRQRDLEVFNRYVKRLGVVNEKVRKMSVGSLPDWSKSGV